MSDVRTVVLTTVPQALAVLEKLRVWVPKHIALKGRVVLTIGDRRTSEANRRQWPILTAFAQQLPWSVNGEAVQMHPFDWKDVLTVAYMGEIGRYAAHFDDPGRLVLLGHRTSEFTGEKFDEWMAYLKAAAATHGIRYGREEQG